MPQNGQVERRNKTRNKTEAKKAKKALKSSFTKACDFFTARRKIVTEDDKLIFYALYKQATVGDCTIKKPPVYKLKALKKFIAWDSRSGLSKKQAMELYISTLCLMFPDFDPTPDRPDTSGSQGRTPLPHFNSKRLPSYKEMQRIVSTGGGLNKNMLRKTGQHQMSAEDRRSYQSSITEDEYKRFTLVKMRIESFASIKSGVHLSAKLPDGDPNQPYKGIVPVIGNVVDKLSIKKKQPGDGLMEEFSGRKEPKININDYLFRLVRYLDKWFYDKPGMKSVGFRSLLMSLVYLDRFSTKIPGFGMSTLNVHRLFAVSMLLGAKFSEDYIIANNYWAEVAGISVDELNELESKFCTYMGFSLFVSDEEVYQQYLKYTN